MAGIFDVLPDLCTKVLGDAVTLYPAGGGSMRCQGIFDDSFAIADPFGDGAGVAGSQPRLHLRDRDAAPMQPGDLVEVRGRRYELIQPEPDGMGVTVFKLNEA